MTVITGQRDAANVAAEQRYIDLAKEILLLEPDETPLTVITKRMQQGGNVRSCGDYLYSWEEDEADARWDAINKVGGYEATDEEFVVDTEEVFAVNDLIEAPRTGEIMFVTALKGSSKIAVTRGYSGTTKAALVDNEPLFVIGVVAEAGSRSFEARSKNPTKISNYTQIFKTSIEATGSWMSSLNQTTPHDWAHQHKKKNIEHLKTIEHAALFGGPSTTTGPNGGRLSTTGGALHFLTANNQDMGGTMTETELSSWVESLTRYGGRQKTVFCSRKFLSIVNSYAVGRLQVVQSDATREGAGATYGISITKYVTALGELNLVPHPLLEGATWGGYAIAVDFAKAAPGYRYLGGGPGGSRDTKLIPNRQENDRDGQKDEIITECGFEYKQIKTGGVATNATA